MEDKNAYSKSYFRDTATYTLGVHTRECFNPLGNVSLQTNIECVADERLMCEKL